MVRATGDSQAGTPVAELYPSLAAVYPDLVFEPYDARGRSTGSTWSSCACPHGASQALVPELRGQVALAGRRGRRLPPARRRALPAVVRRGPRRARPAGRVRLRPARAVPRPSIAGATAVAVPGCYPTASILTLAPLVRAGLVEPTGIIVDAACGASGAGRPPKPTTTFCTVDEDFTAYGLLDHRHTPEIEQAVGEHAGLAPVACRCCSPRTWRR